MADSCMPSSSTTAYHHPPYIRRAHSDSPRSGQPSTSTTTPPPPPPPPSSSAYYSMMHHRPLSARHSRSLDSPPIRPSHDDLLRFIRDRPPNTRLFRALFQYLPFRDSPNDNPEAELALQPGDYVLVSGDIDEDLFYEGRLFDGSCGLVPSNYVERVDESTLYSNQSRGPSLSSPRTSAPPPPPPPTTMSMASFGTMPSTSSLLANVELPPPPPQRSFLLQVPAHYAQLPYDFTTYPDTGSGSGNTCPFPDSICPYPPTDVSKVTVQEVKQTDSLRVPYPRDIHLEKQLSRSVLISWSAPDSSIMPISQYHVCVDGVVKAVVPGSYKCKALIEDIQLNEPRNISIRSVTDKSHSPDAACTITLGKDAQVAPQQLHVSNVTPISIQLSWYPSNSNAEHMVLLNGLKVGVCPPGVFQVHIKSLSPSTMYRAAVRAKDPRAVLEQRPVERYIDFKTLPKIGLPDPPAHVQVETGPQDGTLLVTWKPVDSQPKPPSRAAVAAYLIYADGRKITEIASPTADHVLLRLADFVDDPPLYITIRTKTREGTVSSDSNVVRVPRSLAVTQPSSQQQSRLHQQQLVTGSTQQLSPQPIIGMAPTSSMQQQQSMQHSDGGLLMVQHPTTGTTPQVVPLPSPLLYSQTTADALGAGATTTTRVWPHHSTAVAAAAASQPTMLYPADTNTLNKLLNTATAADQYYIFHPSKLLRSQPIVQEKPSVLEMENSYLLKHHAQPAQQQQHLGYRTLPDPSTFRNSNYATASWNWSALSPATRRRLEPYINNPASTQMRPPMYRQPMIGAGADMRRSGGWKKKSYSLDDEDDYYDGVPDIRITGASSTSEDPYDEWMPMTAPMMMTRRRVTRTNSRTQSEPDLRVDRRLQQAMIDATSSPCRYFVALYDYDHHISPNPNAAHEELTFRKHQLIKVFGDKDADGFYHGQLNGRFGLVPSNMVYEIDKVEAHQFIADQHHRQHHYSHQQHYQQPPRSTGAYDYYDPIPQQQQHRRAIVAGGHRRSDSGWNPNNSDPTLTGGRYGYPIDQPHGGGGNYSDSSTSGGPAIYGVGGDERLQNPALRRTRWGSIKSRSYDHADRRRATAGPIDDYDGGGSGGMRQHQRHYDQQQPPYVSSMRQQQQQHEAPTAVDYYRGSLDRRDNSVPSSRQPPSDVDYDRRKAYDYRGGGAGDLRDSRGGGGDLRDSRGDRPRFEIGEEGSGGGRVDASGRFAGEQRHRDRADDRPPPPRTDAVNYATSDDDRYRRSGGGAPSAAYPQQPYNGYAPPTDTRYDRQTSAGAAPTSAPPPTNGGKRDDIERAIRETVRDSTVKRMIAKFDYDSRELSPNVDAEQVELSFRAGDIITVYGEIDEDGFYVGELGGVRGLVPSNFLEPFTGSAPQQLGVGQMMMDQQSQRPKGVAFSEVGAMQNKMMRAAPQASKPPNQPLMASAVKQSMPPAKSSSAAITKASSAGGGGAGGNKPVTKKPSDGSTSGGAKTTQAARKTSQATKKPDGSSGGGGGGRKK